MRKCLKLNQKQQNELEIFIRDKNHSSKEIKKAQVVLMLDKELGINTTINLTGYSSRQCFDIRKRYLKKGLAVIEDKNRKNPKELLTKKQRNELTEILKTKTPKDYGYDSDYWLSGILADLIWRQYQIKYKSKTSLYVIFKQAKFSYHKPDRKYQARNEQEVQEWKKEAKMKLNQALSEPNTIVLAADEMSLSTGDYCPKSLATARRISKN